MQKILYSLSSAKQLIRSEKPSKIAIVTSSKLKSKLSWAISEIEGKSCLITIPDGEAAKTWKELEKLLKAFEKNKLDRKSLIIILGGGTVGDLVGFAASVYLRGIKYVQVPTTLLAQVDSAHGGKTGINFENIKNQIGTTYFPIATVIDKRFLKSHTDNLITDGLGEIIKYGLIKDKNILHLLKNETIKTLKKSSKLQKIVERSIDVKNSHTSRDVNDRGIRQMLNFGHTIGHALELKYKMSHGEAILHGMIQELELGEKMGITNKTVRKNVLELYKKLEIKLRNNLKLDWKTILRDKKFNGTSIDLPVVIQEGKSNLIKVESNKLRSILGL